MSGEAAAAAASSSNSGAAGATGATGEGQTAATGAVSSSGTGTATSSDFRSTIPEAFREASYLRDVKSADDIFKMLDNSQKLLGKQGKLVPADDAPKEQWDAYYANLGRPESADKYEFTRNEKLKDVADPEWEKAFKDVLFEAGCNPRQFAIIQSKLDELALNQIEAQTSAVDTDVEKYGVELFGAGKVEEGLRQSQTVLASLCPEPVKKFLPMLDAKASIVLAGIMKEVQAKYLKEDQTRATGTTGAGTALNTKDAIRAEVIRLMETPEYKDPFHPGHNARLAEVRATSDKANHLK